MTCIVGIIDKKNKGVIIGGDSAAVGGLDVDIRRDKKVFKNGEFIFGCTSSFRMIQLLQFSLKIPKVYDKDIYEFMCTDFINAVRECFKDGGYLQKETKGYEQGGQFLVGYKDRLFMIDNDFQVAETERDFDSVGCGSGYALGAIYGAIEAKREIIIEELLESSLKAASYFSAGVRPPFHCVSTYRQIEAQTYCGNEKVSLSDREIKDFIKGFQK